MFWKCLHICACMSSVNIIVNYSLSSECFWYMCWSQIFRKPQHHGNAQRHRNVLLQNTVRLYSGAGRWICGIPGFKVFIQLKLNYCRNIFLYLYIIFFPFSEIYWQTMTRSPSGYSTFWQIIIIHKTFRGENQSMKLFSTFSIQA